MKGSLNVTWIDDSGQVVSLSWGVANAAELAADLRADLGAPHAQQIVPAAGVDDLAAATGAAAQAAGTVRL